MVPLIGSVRLGPQPMATVGAFFSHLCKTINELEEEHIIHMSSAQKYQVMAHPGLELHAARIQQS